MRGPLPAVRTGRAEAFPIQLRQQLLDRASLHLLRIPIEQPRHRLIEINNPALLIHDQYPVLNGIKERLQEIAFPRQALDDRLQPFGIQAANPAQDTIDKTGSRHCHSALI